MSYNIESTNTLACSLTMTKEAVQKWGPRWKELAEGVAGDVEMFEEELETGEEGPFGLDAFRWDGENSGRSYEKKVFREFVADLQGEADIVLIRDGEMTGLRIKDGNAVEHEVSLALGDPKTKKRKKR